MDSIGSFLRCFVYILTLMTLGAQEVHFSFRYLPEYRMTERADYSKRINGSYQGYANREVRGVFTSRETEPGFYQVEGTWFRAEEIKKSGVPQALPLDRVERAVFQQNSLGQVQSRGHFPILRGFPQFPSQALSPGDRWEAPFEQVIFNRDGDVTAVLSLYCGYTYKGMESYKERKVHVIEAQYALRNRGYDRNIPLIIEDVQGSHRVTLMIDGETMSPVLSRDSFHEQWIYAGGDRVEYKGFNLVFYEGIQGDNRRGTLDSLAGSLGEEARVIASIEDDDQDESHSDLDRAGPATMNAPNGGISPESLSGFMEDVTLYERDEGIALSLNNLHFLPDQAVILDRDYPLLDTIADALKGVDLNGKTLLVKGHTADIGTMESQMVLSMERARRVVDELVARGIGADSFVYIGMGGEEPLGDNATEEGRKLNRRVEIIIMD